MVIKILQSQNQKNRQSIKKSKSSEELQEERNKIFKLHKIKGLNQNVKLMIEFKTQTF